jgi:hypothetical protein
MKSKQSMPIMWVDYEEFKPETYKGVYLTNLPDRPKFESYTGNFEADFNACSSEAAKYAERFMYSSSVDNWFMDQKEEWKKYH